MATNHQLKNNAFGAVQNNPLASGGTNLVTDSTLDSKLSALTFPFWLTLWGANLNPNSDPNVEIVEVTARPSPNNYTIVRGRQGTTGVAHVLNSNIGLLWTSGNGSEAIPQGTLAQGSVYYIGSDLLPHLLAPGAAGSVLTSQGAGANPAFSALITTDIQNFESSGTWTKPGNAKYVQVIVIGAGGGGGSGTLSSNTGTSKGGGGGGGGGKNTQWFPASILGSTETVTVGTGGPGGAYTASTPHAGTDGGNTSFGAWLVAGGGKAGPAGVSSGPVTGGTGGQGIGPGSAAEVVAGFGGGGGGSGTASGAGDSGADGYTFGAAGGGAGGGAGSSGPSAGGSGGSQKSRNTPISGGSGSSGNGGSASDVTQYEPTPGAGGGGGGSVSTGNSGNGGNGGKYGGGGGGGGTSVTSGTPGTGGTGGNGFAQVITYF